MLPLEGGYMKKIWMWYDRLHEPRRMYVALSYVGLALICVSTGLFLPGAYNLSVRLAGCSMLGLAVFTRE